MEFLPEGIRNNWLLFFFTGALVFLLPLAWYQRRAIQALVTRRFRSPQPEPKLEENLADFPLSETTPGSRRLAVEGLPARMRLVIVAPLGKGATVGEMSAEDVLNQVFWGLGNVAARDKAQIRLWPAQLSSRGFCALFHRMVHRPEPEGQASRWVLVAGPTPPRPRPLLVGLALWTDDPTVIGRLTLEPGQWMNVLQIQNFESPDSASANNPPPPVAAPAPES